MENLQEAGVRRVSIEMLAEKDVNGGFEHEGVVDGNHADFWELVPAGLTAAGLGTVHHIVGDEEEGLEEFGEPAEGGRVEEFTFGEGAMEEDGGGIDDGHAAVAFAAHGIVIEGLKGGMRLAFGPIEKGIASWRKGIMDAMGKRRVREKRIWGVQQANRGAHTSLYHLSASSGRPYCLQCWLKSSTSCGKTVSNSFNETGLNSKSERGAFEAIDAARFGSKDGSQLLRIDARIGAPVLMVI